MNSNQLDKIVHETNSIVDPQIDCTTCGACCRGLMINITKEEVGSTAEHLSLSNDMFIEKYVEVSQGGIMIMNTIPCHFLSENKCNIYEQRFNECRDFPHLHKSNFRDRLFGTLIHYGVCPIIYNVMEILKIRTSFKKEF